MVLGLVGLLIFLWGILYMGLREVPSDWRGVGTKVFEVFFRRVYNRFRDHRDFSKHLSQKVPPKYLIRKGTSKGQNLNFYPSTRLNSTKIKDLGFTFTF